MTCRTLTRPHAFYSCATPHRAISLSEARRVRTLELPRMMTPSIWTKALLPAIRRDPARMAIRPTLRPFELRRSRGSEGSLVRRELGIGAIAEYSVSELLDRSRYLYGSYEYVYTSAFIGQITPGSVVIDVGANIGEYTLLAAQSTGPRGRVLAVEPNRALHGRISRHLRLNRLSNVELVPVALGSSEGEAILTVPAGGSALGTLREDNDASPSTRQKVPVRRLDDVLPKHDRRRLSAIKVDVEGWELEVFLGARDTLAEGKPVLLYECGAEQFEQRHGQFNTPSMTFIEELGYKNHTISMDRHGRWRLRGIESGHDPREDREPWSVLMTVAIHPDSHHDVKMAGQSQLQRCGVFEMLAPGS